MKFSKSAVLFGDTVGSLFCCTFFNKSEGLFLLASKVRKQGSHWVTNEPVRRQFMQRFCTADQTLSKGLVEVENARLENSLTIKEDMSSS